MNMMTQVDAADRKLKRVKINLLRDPRFAFWRGIMMVGKTELVDDIPTACTDGCNELYGRKLVEILDEKMLAFVVLHENLHKIGRDLTTWKRLFEEDAQLANIACDHRINLLLVDMDPAEQTIAFPKIDGQRIGVCDTRFKGMDVPSIYRVLKQEKQNGGGANGVGEGFDIHDWQSANGMTQEAKDKLAKDIDQALRQGEREHRKVNGKGGGNLERELSALLNPKIDWRQVLAEFVRSTCSGRDTSTWRRPNRRFLGQDILMPSLQSERVGHIVVGVDTSGSISGPEITAMLTEVVAVAKQVQPEKIDLLYWDSAVASHEEYNETNLDMLATSTKPRGGGGTSPACVKRHLTDKHLNPECIIMLTDGYVDSWPDFDCPVLWVVTSKNITAQTGMTIHLDKD